jgi:hypothetical protein
LPVDVIAMFTDTAACFFLADAAAQVRVVLLIQPTDDPPDLWHLSISLLSIWALVNFALLGQ